jgi:predicted Zn-dependent peptidase
VPAIAETVNIMRSLGLNVPQKELDQKRMDALNSFVFNVDSPTDLVQVYARYFMRNEPLDTLEKIQDAFFNADKGDLQRLAVEYLDPDKIQIFLVGDKNIKVKGNRANESTLEDILMDLAESLGLPYVELELR